MNKDLNDRLFEDILEYALEKECERMGDELPSEKELSQSISVSPEFNKNMNTILNHEKRKIRNRHIFSVAKKVAACIAIAIVLNITLLIGVQAYRVQFFNMCIDVKDEFTTFFFEDKENINATDLNQIPSDWQSVYLPTYIPTGFSFSSSSGAGNIKRIFYINKDTKQTINFSYCPIKTSTFSFDTENSDMSKIVISENEGYISEKDSNGEIRTSIIWRDGTMVFTLISTLEKSTSIKVAEKIQKIK